MMDLVDVPSRMSVCVLREDDPATVLCAAALSLLAKQSP